MATNTITAGMTLTNTGRNLLARALTGKQLQFTRVIVGDGTITNQNILTIGNLISRKKEIPIIQLRRTQEIGTVEILCEMTNTDLAEGFWVREFGLFARDPDTNQEILYSYRNVGAQASYFPKGGGVDAIYYILSIITVIDQAPNVTSIIVNGNNYVTYINLEARIESLFGAYRNVLGFWTYNVDGEKVLRPATTQQVKNVLLGEYDMDSINARIKALEDALSQVLAAIEIEDLYPAHDYFLPEDFYNVNELDLYKCKVKITGITAGSDFINCEPKSGILPGSFYMLTDGLNQELIQVKSASISNNLLHLTLVAPVTKNYLNSCMLYRTSANILNGMAMGAGLRRSITWPAGITWKGTTANTQYTIPLNTTANNANSFEIDGAGAFDPNGRATLEI